MPNNTEPPKSHFFKYFLIILLIVLLLLGIGFYLNHLKLLPVEFVSKPSEVVPITDLVETPIAEEAEEEPAPLSIGAAINSVTAKVTSVGDQFLMIEFDPSVFSASLTEIMEKKVIATKDTVIEENIQKPEEQFLNEHLAFEKALREFEEKVADNAEGLELPEPPEGFVVKTLTLLDLKAGDTVEILTDSDVITNDSVEAIRVLLNP